MNNYLIDVYTHLKCKKLNFFLARLYLIDIICTFRNFILKKNMTRQKNNARFFFPVETIWQMLKKLIMRKIRLFLTSVINNMLGFFSSIILSIREKKICRSFKTLYYAKKKTISSYITLSIDMDCNWMTRTFFFLSFIRTKKEI